MGLLQVTSSHRPMRLVICGSGLLTSLGQLCGTKCEFAALPPMVALGRIAFWTLVSDGLLKRKMPSAFNRWPGKNATLADITDLKIVVRNLRDAHFS